MVEQEITEKEEIIQPSFPVGRVKKIVKLDQDIKKINSEALFLVSLSTDLFLQFLAEKSTEISNGKKQKTLKLEHLRMAVKKHQPTNDFLLDSLPLPIKISTRPSAAENRSHPSVEKPLSVGTRRIDDFFSKSSSGTSNEINDS